MSSPKILDLDKLIPEKRIVKLAGTEIDVSTIPSRVTMEIAKKTDVLTSGSSESFPALTDMIIKIMKPSKPDITEDWLIDHTSIDQLIALIEFILEPLQEKVNEQQGEQGKNATSP